MGNEKLGENRCFCQKFVFMGVSRNAPMGMAMVDNLLPPPPEYRGFNTTRRREFLIHLLLITFGHILGHLHRILRKFGLMSALWRKEGDI